jgi:chromosome partitioning protein
MRAKNTRIIAVANHKGGVGKTTSVANIGAALMLTGAEVLLIDMDPQANLTQSLGVREPKAGIYEALRGVHPITPIKLMPTLQIVPASLDLGGAELELAGEPGREYILRDLIAPIASQYHYILIDSPPALGLLTLNALCTAKEVLIPIQAEYLALHGLTKLGEIIDKIGRRVNKDLHVAGIFLTQYDSRKTLHRQIEESLQKNYPELLLETKIRDNVTLAEAPTAGLDIFRYRINSHGAQDYKELAKEIEQLPKKKAKQNTPKL